jgi:hypothetical protein
MVPDASRISKNLKNSFTENALSNGSESATIAIG